MYNTLKVRKAPSKEGACERGGTNAKRAKDSTSINIKHFVLFIFSFLFFSTFANGSKKI